MEILGVEYDFDKTKDRVLKRGLIDPYLLSPRREEWVVIDEYIFWSARYQVAVVVPRWFITDLSSIPRPVRPLIPVNGNHRIPSILHDLGYAFGNESKLTRIQWDILFDDFNKLYGVNFAKRKAMQSGLFVGGWASFNNFRLRLAPMRDRAIIKREITAFDLDINDSELIIV